MRYIQSYTALFSFRIFYAGLSEVVFSFNPNDLPGGYSKWEPPDPISNSEVKLLSADDSVGSPHVKVGHCQDFIFKARIYAGFFLR